MIWIDGFWAFRYRPTPEMVPPVPIPATKWVIRPAVWRQSSGPVDGSWDAGLAGLWYWSGWKAPGIVAVSRSATE